MGASGAALALGSVTQGPTARRRYAPPAQVRHLLGRQHAQPKRNMISAHPKVVRIDIRAGVEYRFRNPRPLGG